jgi:hypothetical protein
MTKTLRPAGGHTVLIKRECGGKGICDALFHA